MHATDACVCVVNLNFVTDGPDTFHVPPSDCCFFKMGVMAMEHVVLVKPYHLQKHPTDRCPAAAPSEFVADAVGVRFM